jgi:hypothetical protein
VIFWLFGNDFGIRINDLCAEGGGKAVDGAVDLLDLACEIAGGGGDGGDAEGGPVPDCTFVELGDGEIEGVAEFVLEGANDVAAVLEGLGVWDFELDGEFGDGHF